MPTRSPKIDQRTYQQLVEQTERLARLYAGWEPYPDGRPDGGQAMVRIFARMAEVLIERLNRVPDKNFLAFLDLIGTQILPPQPARVPLTFQLATGSTNDAVVPELTQVTATPAVGDPGPVVFETERELVVTRSELAAVLTREPDHDRYGGDVLAIATGQAEGSFSAFSGDTSIPHVLYLAYQPFFADPRSKTIQLDFSAPDAAGPPFDWLAAVRWSFWNGLGWESIARAESTAGAAGNVRLFGVPAIAPTSVGGVTSTWLRGDLQTALPRTTLVQPPASPDRPVLQRSDMLADAGLSVRLPTTGESPLSNVIPLQINRPFAPFDLDGRQTGFYVAWDEGFSKPGAAITITLEIDPARPVVPAIGLGLAWECSTGGQAWALLGSSAPNDDGQGTFVDTTLGLTRSGQVSFVAPTTWVATEVEGARRFWLRARVTGGLTRGYTSAPVVQRLALAYNWTLPRIGSISTRIEVQNAGLIPAAGFANQAELDLTKDVLPFGEKPKFNDTFYLECNEAFALQTQVTLDVVLSNPRPPAPAVPQPRGDPGQPATLAASPLAAARPSPDLQIVWEYWNGKQWVPLATGVPFPSDLLVDTFDNPVETGTLTLNGQCPAGATVQVQEQFTVATGAGAVSVPARVSGGAWTAQVTLTPGLHALQVTSTVRRQRLDSRWLLVFQGTSDQTPALLQAQYERKSPTEAVVRGTAAPGSRIRVHNAATNTVSPDNLAVGANGRFEIVVTNVITFQPGRNDLLVFATTAQGAFATATVITDLLAGGDETTWGFTRNGRVGFRLPADAAPTSVGGQEGNWVRARIAGGNYGVDARYDPLRDKAGNLIDASGQPTQLPIYQLVPATFQPPSIKTITVSYTYNPNAEAVALIATENDFAVTPISSLVRHQPVVTPFLPMRDLRPALYLGFRRPDAESGFDNRAASLFIDVDDVLYSGMEEGDHTPDEQASVTWEYWTGRDWNRLGTRDETRGFARRGLVSFVGPQIFPSRVDFGLAEPLFWLRAVWERGTYVHLPRLRHILTNTTWASHTLTTVGEVLGSGTGEPDQRLRLARAPVLPGQAVEVRELDPPSEVERLAIEAEEGADAVMIVDGPEGQPAEIWVRWHEVPDFYGSGPRSRHYTLDRITGEVRFGNGRQGLRPPPGVGNLRAARYQTGGGIVGNRPANSISQLSTTIPSVDSANNLAPSGGGAEQETFEALMARGPRGLRNRDRAVAIADFEDLAFQASPEVALVRGIPATGASSAGAVLLIITPRSDALKPVPSLELLARVQDYLAERLVPTADVVVHGPDWLRVSVNAEVAPLVPEEATDVQAAVLARLAAFLHPLTGGLDGTGWAYGRKPYRSDIFALVERTPGVSHVRQLTVDEQPDDGIARPDRFLVYSGDHVIVMAGVVNAADV